MREIEKNRIDTITAAEDLEREVNFKDEMLLGSEYFSNVIGFALGKLKCEHIELTPHKGEIAGYLDYNDIPFRRVKLPEKLLDNEHSVLVVNLKKDTDRLLVFYQESRKNYTYDAISGKIEHFQKSSDLTVFGDSAYEIYPSMPADIKTAWDVLSFAFGSESAAIGALVITSAAVMLFNLSIPMMTNLLVSNILPEQQASLLLDTLFLIILIVIGSVAAQYLQQTMLLRLETVTDLRLQTATWDRLLRLPMKFFSKYTTGDMASRVSSISMLRQLLGSGALSTIVSSVFALSYFILMYQYDSSLANWAALITLLGISFVAWIASKQVKYQFTIQETEAEVTNFALQSLIGSAQIRSTGIEPFLFLQWMKRISKYARTKITSGVLDDALKTYTEVIIPISTTAIFTAAVLRILNAGQSGQDLNAVVASVVAFYAALTAFNGKVNEAVNQIALIYAQGVVLWKRATPILYASVERGYRPEAIRAELKGEVRLRDVSFKYPTAPEILFKDLNFKINVGKHTALTGKSGCGKTTIFRLLLGFEEPTSGEIFVDNIPLDKLAIRSYRKQIGVVLQNSQLSPGPLYDAITGGLSFSEDQVWEALEHAQIADEVNSMPMKLDTVLSQGATNISGGQRQRIAIARAFIIKPKILLMDEATSALDNFSQEKITEYIESLGITRITIAHRFSTIQKADTILKLENKTAHQVTVDELMGKSEYLH